MSIIMHHMYGLYAQEEAIRNELADIRAEIETMHEAEEEHEDTCCYGCGRILDVGEEAFLCDEEVYCEDCVTMCEYCNTPVSNEDAIVANSHLRWETEYTACPSCADNHFYVCDSCEEWVTEGGIWAQDGDRTICINCCDGYVTCGDCGEILYCDDAYRSDRDDGYYCHHCYVQNDHNGSDNISDYGHDQYHPRYSAGAFNDMPDEDDVKRHFGVELEVDCGTSRSDLADALFDEIDDAENLFKCKHDGSLGDEGLEIVSMPCSFRFMMEEFPFDEIAKIAVRKGYKSHDTRTCGLHIHVSRIGLGVDEKEQDLTVAKLMILFDRFWNKLVPFSRRDVSQIDQWAKKPNLEIDEDEDDDVIKDKAKEYRGRYQAINITNEMTIEFRLFRGTLKVSTIKATIQFVNYIIDFVINHTLKDCMKTSWDVLFSSTPYEELNEYIENRHL